MTRRRGNPVSPAKSYEAEPQKLREQVAGFFSSKEGPSPDPSEHQGKAIKGLVAPNYEVNVAGPIYAWAYKELREAEAPDVYILLGTAHAGLAGPVAVTDKDFESPLGVVPVNRPLMEALRSKGGDALFADELRHETEHSIEFQLPFLQETVGARQSISIIPILSVFPPGCLIDPSLKDVADQVERFVAVLKDAIAASGQRVCFLASANLAHIGLRYGDDKAPTDFFIPSLHANRPGNVETRGKTSMLRVLPNFFSRNRIAVTCWASRRFTCSCA